MADPFPTTPDPDPEFIHEAASLDRLQSRLPTSLDADYQVIRRIDAGGQGLVLLAENRNGERHAIKVYDSSGRKPNTEVLATIQKIDADHVVGIIDFGIEDGLTYEVLEYVEAGTLRDLMDSDRAFLTTERVVQLVGDLSAAIHSLNSRSIYHGDIKPSNLLLRGMEPLNVCLTDFGSAMVLTDAMRRATKAGSFQYMPPEGDVLTSSRDYWAFGIVLLEIIVGQHPFAELEELTVEYRRSTQGFDLSVIDDAELRHLVAGLLLYKPEQRWNHEQVLRWLAGNPDELPVEALSSLPVFEFAGSSYTNSTDLVNAFLRNWSAAVRVVNGKRSVEVLERWLIGLEGAAMASLLDAFEEEGRGADFQLASVINALAPELPPGFRGHSLAVADLPGLAAEAFRDPKSENGADVEALYRQSVLDAYAPNHADLAAVSKSWRSEVDEFLRMKEVLEEAYGQLNDEQLRRAFARSLSCVTSSTEAKKLTTEAKAARSKVSDEPYDDALKSKARIGRDLAAIAFQHRASEAQRKRNAVQEKARKEERAAAQQVKAERKRANRRVVAKASVRHLSWGLAYTAIAAPAAGEITFAQSGGIESAAIFIGILTGGVVLAALGVDLLAAMVSKSLRVKDPTTDWAYLLAIAVGVAATYYNYQFLPFVNSRLMWGLTPLSVLITHFIVRIPDRDESAHPPEPTELLIAKILSWLSGLALAPFVISLLAQRVVAFGEFVSPEDWVLADRIGIAFLVFGASLIGLTTSAYSRLEGRAGTTSRSVLPLSALFGLSYFAWVWGVGLDRLGEIDAAHFVGLMAAWLGTGVQLLVRRRPPRILWYLMGLGALIPALWNLLETYQSLGLDLQLLALPVFWAVAAIRLVIIGVEEVRVV